MFTAHRIFLLLSCSKFFLPSTSCSVYHEVCFINCLVVFNSNNLFFSSFLFSFLKQRCFRNIRRSDQTPFKHRCYRHPQGKFAQYVLRACFVIYSHWIGYQHFDMLHHYIRYNSTYIIDISPLLPASDRTLPFFSSPLLPFTDRLHAIIVYYHSFQTIDNDVDLIDRSFGFTTSVEAAQTAILSAKTEARCNMPNGIGEQRRRLCVK